MATEIITVNRDCDAIEIPSGTKGVLPSGTGVRVMQFLGSSWTVTSAHGMFRVDVKDADALGLTPPVIPAQGAARRFGRRFQRENGLGSTKDGLRSRDTGKHCRSRPHLLLRNGAARSGRTSDRHQNVHDCARMRHGQRAESRCREQARESPRCEGSSRGNCIRAPWNPSLMSEAAKLQLGFDL